MAQKVISVWMIVIISNQRIIKRRKTEKTQLDLYLNKIV